MHDDWIQALVLADLRFAGGLSEFMLEPNVNCSQKNNSDIEVCYCYSSSVNAEHVGRKLSHR